MHSEKGGNYSSTDPSETDCCWSRLYSTCVYVTVQYASTVLYTFVRNCTLIGDSYQMKAAFGQSHPPLYSLGLNETSAFLGAGSNEDLQKRKV